MNTINTVNIVTQTADNANYRFLYKKAIQNLSFGDAGKAIRCIQRIENILTNQLIKKDFNTCTNRIFV